jgi:hypothetical protein
MKNMWPVEPLTVISGRLVSSTLLAKFAYPYLRIALSVIDGTACCGQRSHVRNSARCR